MKLARQTSAFTLVELLVVISIIGILAGIAFPAYTTIQERGKQTKALTYAKQIGTVCKIYAGDYDGRFPTYVDPTSSDETTYTNSNDAFTALLEGGYVNDETLFYIPDSAFCSSPTIDKDEEVEEGENHWALYVGLTDTDNSSYPLIADGFADEGSATYATDKKVEGGVWGGKRAVVCYVDMSARVENLRDEILEGNFGGNSNVNLLDPGSTDGYMTGVEIANPK
jgi:prepilin-type N-terminal cleavage/methylation domain-containing protein